MMLIIHQREIFSYIRLIIPSTVEFQYLRYSNSKHDSDFCCSCTSLQAISAVFNSRHKHIDLESTNGPTLFRLRFDRKDHSGFTPNLQIQQLISMLHQFIRNLGEGYSPEGYTYAGTHSAWTVNTGT